MKKFAILSLIFLALCCFFAIEAVPGLTTPDDVSNEICMECHSDADMVGEDFVVDLEHFQSSIHGEMEIGCADCHTSINEADDAYDHGVLGPATGCQDCHSDVYDSIMEGRHNPENEGTPGCTECHSHGHEIVATYEETSPANKLNQPETCGMCHQGEIVEDFMKSVHGGLLKNGDDSGPACSTCHDAHRSSKADILRNPAFKVEVTETCGECHTEELSVYSSSIHGEKLLKENVTESASCVDCHSSHTIQPAAIEGSQVHPTEVAKDCSNCHSDSKLIRRFGLRSNVVQTFEQSYHGQAGGFGDTQVANCASCHTHHAIYKASDERASVHPSNLRQTCGECHPGATENFIQGKIHVFIGDKDNNYWAFLVKNLYIGLIAAVIGGMIIHNLMDLFRKLKIKWSKSKKEPHVIRMTKLERILHASLAISFLLLVYTGFALLAPNAWWVAPINMISNSDEFRGVLHRICGVVLFAVSIHHLWFLFFHKRGIEQRKHFMPRVKDVIDLKDNILWYLGRRKERPKFGRFTYMEKAEYWALVWGTAVMVATGFILWFKELALMFIPQWLWEVALVVHLYEAILAALAILVWHFYFVMINPDESPLAQTFVTGRMPLEEVAHCHAEEYEQIMKEREAKELDNEGTSNHS